MQVIVSSQAYEGGRTATGASSRLPRVVATSVIRSAHQGQSHGGVYLVDLDSSRAEQVIDWDHGGISWAGRGMDRGLRGVAFHKGMVYIAASDEIFVFDSAFDLKKSYRNRYLRHCHEISVSGRALYMTSTGFDSVLELDLESEQFTRGFHLTWGGTRRALAKLGLVPRPGLVLFDPKGGNGPEPRDRLHINNVVRVEDALYVSGTGMPYLLRIEDGRVDVHARLPYGTHNAQPFGDKILVNDTANDRVAFLDRRGRVTMQWAIPRFPAEKLEMATLPRDHARQAFGRGLCVWNDTFIIAGSSPATISVYRPGSAEPYRLVNLSMDVRNAIHGLAVWPFDRPGESRVS